MSFQNLGKTRIQLTTEHTGHPPKVCQQQSVTFAPEDGGKYRQELPHGTPPWQEAYDLLRNTVEGANGHAKDGNFEAIGDASRRRFRGRAAQSVLIAFGLYAANLRKLDTFDRLAVVDPDGNLRKPARVRKPRGLQNYRRDDPSLLPDTG